MVSKIQDEKSVFGDTSQNFKANGERQDASSIEIAIPESKAVIQCETVQEESKC